MTGRENCAWETTALDLENIAELRCNAKTGHNPSRKASAPNPDHEFGDHARLDGRAGDGGHDGVRPGPRAH